MLRTHARSISRFSSRARVSPAVLAGLLGGGLAPQALAASEPAPAGFRRLPVREYRDKMKGKGIEAADWAELNLRSE